jgi:hypothetical protein
MSAVASGSPGTVFATRLGFPADTERFSDNGG